MICPVGSVVWQVDLYPVDMYCRHVVFSWKDKFLKHKSFLCFFSKCLREQWGCPALSRQGWKPRHRSGEGRRPAALVCCETPPDPRQHSPLQLRGDGPKKPCHNQCCGSRMFIPDPYFSIPDPVIKRFRIPDPDPHQRLSIFNPKNCFQTLGNMIRDVYHGSGYRILIFYPSRIPDPGVKKAPDPGSGILVIIINQCCGSGMFIPDPGSGFFSILDTGTESKEQQESINCL